MTRITNSNPLSLDNVGRGEVIRRFDEAMSAALKNIKDPSIPTKKPRKIFIEAVIDPLPDRAGGNISIFVNAKLPPPEPYASQVIISEEYGELVAHESVSVEPPIEHDALDLENI